MYLIAETTEETCNFYIDEVIGAVAGTKIDGPAAVKLIRGDLDGDERITIADLVILKSSLVEGFKSDQTKYTGDIDSNTLNEALDAVVLQKYLLGTITEFPIG